MTRWKRQIRIKQFLDEGKPFEEVRDQVVAVLRRQPEYDIESERYDDEFWNIVDEMTDTDTVRYFDLTLNALYDWADDNKIWIGGDKGIGSKLPE